MFKKNTKHLQRDMFGLKNSMPESLMKDAVKTEEYAFYDIIFCNIDEEIFSVLYSDKKSRPNAPVNAMVAALLFQHRRMWTYNELFSALKFNLLFKMALGLDDLETIPFCQATLFNFQNRLNDHFIKTGENLLEKVFDGLTKDQLKKLKLKTTIQRTDSTFAASNIRNMSHLQLLVEMLIRIYRVLSDADKKRVRERFAPYVEKTATQYVYTIKSSDIPHELEKLADLYLWINQNIKPAYSNLSIFKTFDRVFAEHFTVSDETIQPKPRNQLHSGCLQSPDDLDATYREKNGKKSKGQVINIVETAHPDNDIDLITDVAVAPNNQDDSKILNERIDKLQEKTPELNELHTDGAYGSTGNDRKFEEHQITHIQSDMRGREASVPIDIEKENENQYTVSCPFQQVSSRKTRRRFKAEFDLNICSECSHSANCPTFKRKKHRAFYFAQDDYLRKRRIKARTSIPPDRRKLRNNVEATMHEFTCKMPRGKLKVRGAFKASIFAYSVAASVNFGRIYRHMMHNPGSAMPLFEYFQFFKEQFLVLSSFCKQFLHRKRFSLDYAMSLNL